RLLQYFRLVALEAPVAQAFVVGIWFCVLPHLRFEAEASNRLHVATHNCSRGALIAAALAQVSVFLQAHPAGISDSGYSYTDARSAVISPGATAMPVL